jgi:anti-anti-sigma regulatory factor
VLCADGEQLRAGVAAWVDHELARGSKVLYKGWFAPERSNEWGWLGQGPRVAARGRGQLETLSLPDVLERCEGRSEGLWALQRREVEDALGAGWPSVAMTHETTRRHLDEESDIAAFVQRERGYDRLARWWPVNTLCQLSPAEEQTIAVRESLAFHHRDLVTDRWSASMGAGAWRVCGELDVAEREHFRAAVRGVLLARVNDEVHIDLGAVRVLDSTCADVLVDAARATVPRRRFVLHHTSSLAATMLRLRGLSPDAVILRDDQP